MNKERLQRVADILKEIPDVQFNMKYWGKKNDSGTVCCAIGWYVEKTPEVLDEELGFTYWTPETLDVNGRELPPDCKTLAVVRSKMADHHFDISNQEFDELFSDPIHRKPAITREEVIANIENFIKENS